MVGCQRCGAFNRSLVQYGPDTQGAQTEFGKPQQLFLLSCNYISEAHGHPTPSYVCSYHSSTSYQGPLSGFHGLTHAKITTHGGITNRQAVSCLAHLQGGGPPGLRAACVWEVPHLDRSGSHSLRSRESAHSNRRKHGV